MYPFKISLTIHNKESATTIVQAIQDNNMKHSDISNYFFIALKEQIEYDLNNDRGKEE